MEKQVRLVDAIDEGKIVKVSEDYARREGLIILRRPVQSLLQNRKEDENKSEKEDYKEKYGLDRFRKPLRYKQNDVINSLIEHFHWQIVERRKQRNMTRKQVALSIGCSEQDLKLIENGILPRDDYVLVNKIEKFLGINLRKDGMQYHASMRDIAMARENKKENVSPKNEEKVDAESLIGNEIEILE